MKFHIETKPKKETFKQVDLLLMPVWLDAKGKPGIWGGLFSEFSSTDQNLLKNYIASRDHKAGEQKLIRLNNSPAFVYVAVESEFNEKKLAMLIRRFTRIAKTEGFKVISIYADDFEQNQISAERVCGLIAQNSLLAHYEFSEAFKSAPPQGWKRVETFIIATFKDKKVCESAVREGEIIATGVNRCRALSNWPPSELKPEGMAEAARTVAGAVKSVKVTVFNETRLKKEGMNAILAVGQGSASAPRLIIMEYAGAKKVSRPHLALVGKGVTFDSGGLNIKPGEHMADMHMDMSGGSAVIYAISVIAQLKLPINVIGLIPAVENMPSGLSYRQGDIIKAYGGKTIEIGNTDAEGRVIMADAIEYAKTKKPQLIVGLSTLTGAAMIALGLRHSGLFIKGNKKLQDILEQLGTDSGDLLWSLPLTEENERDVEGNLADVTNTHKNNSRWGGASSGAGFLSHFAKGANFAHIDMAPRMIATPEEELGKGAVGYGVSLFVEMAKRFAEIEKAL